MGSQFASSSEMVRLLVVDDDRMIRYVANETMSAAGFNVETAEDGASACAKLVSFRPDLILLDLDLPDIDGFQLCERWRADPAFALTPVCVMTGLNDPACIQRAYEVGANDFVVKPAIWMILVQRLRQLHQANLVMRELASTRDQLQSTLEAIPDLLFEVGLDGRYFDYRARQRELLVVPASEFLGRTVAEVLPPDAAAAALAAIQEANRDGYSSGRLYALPLARGDRWFELSVSRKPVRDDAAPRFIVLARDVTKRRRAELALKDSEERLRLALTAAGQGTWDLNVQTGEAIVSPEYASMLGFDPADFVESNQRWRERLHPDDLAPVSAAYEDYVAGLRSDYRVEFRQRTASGEWKWILSLGKIVGHDAEGRPLRLIGTHTDISERKATEAALRASQQRLNEAQQLGNTGHWEYDVQHGDLFWSDELFRIYGVSREIFVPTYERVVALFHSEDRQAVEDAYREAVREKRIFEFEHRIVRPDGSIRIVTERARTEYDDAGNPRVSVGSVHDVTERRNAERDLRKLWIAVEQSACMVVVGDKTGRIEYANPQFETTTGYPIAEAIGRPICFPVRENETASLRETVAAATSSGAPWKGEFVGSRKDGGLYWEDATISPVMDASGRIGSYVAIRSDITQRRLLEESEREQRRIAETLRDAAVALGGSLDFEAVLDCATERLAEVVQFDAAAILVKRAGQVLAMRTRDDDGEPGIGRTARALDRLPAAVEFLLDSGGSCIVNDTRFDVRWTTGVPALESAGSVVGVALESHGTVNGAILVGQKRVGAFRDDDVRRLIAFGAQAALALENARLFSEAHTLATTDGLTLLKNRRYFFDVARFEFDRMNRFKRDLSLISIDVDHFKRINDTYGHAAGDHALCEVSRRIASAVRAVDLAARMGGEEFVVMMPEIGEASAAIVAERIRSAVGSEPLRQSGLEIPISASLGVASLSTACDSLDTLLGWADRAMYAAKAGGRNRVIVRTSGGDHRGVG